jgi:hypothetical protein
MARRRDILGSVGTVATVGLAGYFGVEEVQSRGGGDAAVPATDDTAGTARQLDDSPLDSMADAVTFARNVEEVRGHLTSSATLLEREDVSGADLHAGHGSDYFAPVLTPLRDVDPDLATRLRGRISSLPDRLSSMDAEEYRNHLDENVYPLLTGAMAAVVPAGVRDSQSFRVRVMNALAGRIADEYSAAVPSAGTIELAGEYWDGRGFLTRIEAHYGDVESGLGGAGGDVLGRLRGEMEAVAAAGDVVGSTLAFRVRTTAAAPLPAARIEGREDALAYARNLEELRGHLVSSAALIDAADVSAAELHAGHAADYVMPLLPAVHRADPELATQLLERLPTVGDQVSAGADAYETYLDDEIRPLLDEVESAVMPEEFVGDTAFTAALILALAGRIEDEYRAAVTEDEVIELYGEYWDARGFLTRIEAHYPDIESDLDDETRAEVSEELDIIRTELETAATPDDLGGSVAALERFLGDVADD